MNSLIIPDGHRPNLPKVEVHPNTLEVCGDISLDYEGLEELYRKDLDVKPEVQPHLIFDPFRRNIAGQYKIFSQRTQIDAERSYNLFGENGLMQVIMHEGKHMADFSNRPVRSYGDILLQVTAALGGGYAAAKLASVNIDPDVLAVPPAYLFGANVGFSYAYKYSPLEHRANSIQNDQELLDKYKNVVSFANFS